MVQQDDKSNLMFFLITFYTKIIILVYYEIHTL